VGRRRWRCDKESGHGHVSLEHALGASCNVFYYAMGDRLGTDPIAKWAHLLGLGSRTGFDVGGEIPGVMPDEAWHDKRIAGGYQHGMSLNIAIGQGDVNVTPMQQAVLYGAIASGTVWKPQVVTRIEDPKGNTLQEFPPVARGRVTFKKETRAALLEGLVAAVNKPFGTAYGSRLKDVVAAGKTGTAQVVKLGARRLKASQLPYFERDHAWFATFAPVEDPEIVVVVLNEHAGFGASNAAPTASALLKYYFELKLQDAEARDGRTVASAPVDAASVESSAPARPPAAAPAPVDRASAELRPVPAAGPAEPVVVPIPPAAAPQDGGPRAR
jgi:penicillin-binding protein 2